MPETPACSTDDERWAAVMSRDSATDGRFWYAVRTTGVFCRPVCPSRRPRRSNVAFYDSCDAAAGDGFRPCLRCRPVEAVVFGAEVDRFAAVIEVGRLIENALDEAMPGPAVAELAAATGWSSRHLNRLFKGVTGVTIAAYVRARRADRARALLHHDNGSVTEAAFAAGYGSLRAFYDHAASRLGTSPEAYRHGSPGAWVIYRVFASPLGRVLVAATERGLCAVRIGSDDAVLVAELEAEFSQATVVDGAEAAPGVLDGLANVVVNLALGRRDAAGFRALPVDLQATAFQAEVWEALQAIPAGETRTYGEVAASMGRPASYRAVANACAANPLALLIPCHLVIPANGDAPGGYRWGPERKAALIP